MESKLSRLYDRIPTVTKGAIFATALTASAMVGAAFGYHLGKEDGVNAGYEAGFKSGVNSPIRPMRERAGWIKMDDSTIDDSLNVKEGEQK